VLRLTGLCWLKALGGWSHQAICLCERKFGWMDIWELTPEGLGSLWLITSATWRGGGGAFWLKATIIRVAGPLLNYTLAFALQLRKCTENLSQVVEDYSLRRLGRQPRLACWTSVHLGYPWMTSVSPWSAQVPSKLHWAGWFWQPVFFVLVMFRQSAPFQNMPVATWCFQNWRHSSTVRRCLIRTLLEVSVTQGRLRRCSGGGGGATKWKGRVLMCITVKLWTCE
jgi:hypothetical protein